MDALSVELRATRWQVSQSHVAQLYHCKGAPGKLLCHSLLLQLSGKSFSPLNAAGQTCKASFLYRRHLCLHPLQMVHGHAEPPHKLNS